MIKIPPVVQRYHSYIIALDHILQQDYDYYVYNGKINESNSAKIRILSDAAIHTYAYAVGQYDNIDQYDTKKFIDSLLSGWFG